MADGYPSRTSETAGLLRDQFIKTPRSSKWYDMYTEKKDFVRSKVSSGSPDPAKLNSSFSRVARHSLPSAPSSQSINQDILRRWERSAREQTFMCNQAAGLSCCLGRVQDSMVAQLKTLHHEKGKGKSSVRSQHAVDELDYLVTFIISITQAMAHTMHDLPLVHHRRSPVATTPMLLQLPSHLTNQERDCKFTCKLVCCQSCSFCQRLSAKERCKSR